MKKNTSSAQFKSNLEQQKIKDIKRYSQEMGRIGVKDFPPYESPETYSHQFRRCSILQSDNFTFSTASSVSVKKTEK